MKFEHGQEVSWASLDSTREFRGVFVGLHPTEPSVAIVIKEGGVNFPSSVEAHRLYAAPKIVKKKMWFVLWSDGDTSINGRNPKETHSGAIKRGAILGIKEFEVEVREGEGLC